MPGPAADRGTRAFRRRSRRGDLRSRGPDERRHRRQGRASRRARCAAPHRTRTRPQDAPRVPAPRAPFPSRHAAPRGAAHLRERRSGASSIARGHATREPAQSCAHVGHRSRPPRRARRALSARSRAGGHDARPDGLCGGNVRLNRLRLLNFRQHADTEIEFDSGLTGIIGPNGAGKSTVLEAIAWALYGGDTARGGKDSIRFSRAAPRASVRVELDFELGGHRYGVVRGLTMAELYLDGSAQPIADSVTTVGEILQRRLGMSRSEFFNTYFTGQKELAVMAMLSATERAQFLSRVLGYEKLRTAQELSDVRRRELRSEITGMRSGMPDAEVVTAQIAVTDARREETTARLAGVEVERARLQAQVDALAPRWIDAQRQRDESQQLEGDLRVAQSELQGLQRNAERLTAELQHVSAAREALVPLVAELVPFHELGNDLARMRDLAVHDGRRQALLEQERALAAELEELREQRTRVQAAPALEEQVTGELEARRRAHDESQGQLELRRTEWVRDRQEAETRRNALRAQYAELKDQRDKLVALGDEGTCPTCQRPLGDHYRQVLDLLDNQLETVSADGSYFKSRLEQLEAMPEDVAALDEQRRKLQQEGGALEGRVARRRGGGARRRP